MSRTIECELRFARRARGRKELRTEAAGPALPAGRVPRVARLLALAWRMDRLVHDGLVEGAAGAQGRRIDERLECAPRLSLGALDAVEPGVAVVPAAHPRQHVPGLHSQRHHRALLLALGATACNTVQGAGEDIESVGSAIDEAAEDAQR